MSEYNRLKLAAANWRRKATETTKELARVLTAVDEGLSLDDVDLAVRSIENLHQRDQQRTELVNVEVNKRTRDCEETILKWDGVANERGQRAAAQALRRCYPRAFQAPAAESTKAPVVERGSYPFHVYPGSEKVDLGPKGEPAVLCQSEEQAKHMARFWGEAGYYEEVK